MCVVQKVHFACYGNGMKATFTPQSTIRNTPTQRHSLELKLFGIAFDKHRIREIPIETHTELKQQLNNN